MGVTCALDVHGDPGQRGRQLGSATGADIRAFLAEGQARLEWIAGRTLERDVLGRAVARHAAEVERALPDVAAAVHGLAEGAEIEVEQAWLLQLRRELMAGDRAADCTTLAASGPRPWLAQTVDLAGDLAPHARVVRERDGERTTLQLTFTGLLGYLGLNDRGLAVGINMVTSGDWRPGVPPYLVIRHLLGLGSVAECVDELARLPRASSRCYTLLDRHELVMVETTCTRVAVLRGESLVHTNHYLDPELAPLDHAHVMVRRESRQRYQRARDAFERAGDAAALSDATLFDLLAHHGDGASCFHAGGDPRRHSTAAAVVLRPAAGHLAVRGGPPCSGDRALHDLRGSHG